MNEVDVDEGQETEAEDVGSGNSAGALGWQPSNATTSWTPWGAGGAYPLMVPYPMAAGAAAPKPAEAQISEVSEVRRSGAGALPTAYDLI